MSDSPPPLAPERTHSLWTWYVAYCVAMTLMSLALAACGVISLVAGPQEEGVDAAQLELGGWICIVFGALMAGPYASAPFLPRRAWAWVFHVVLISIGMASLCCAPAAIPLLIHWLKPGTRSLFGVAN